MCGVCNDAFSTKLTVLLLTPLPPHTQQRVTLPSARGLRTVSRPGSSPAQGAARPGVLDSGPRGILREDSRWQHEAGYQALPVEALVPWCLHTWSHRLVPAELRGFGWRNNFFLNIME